MYCIWYWSIEPKRFKEEAKSSAIQLIFLSFFLSIFVWKSIVLYTVCYCGIHAAQHIAAEKWFLDWYFETICLSIRIFDVVFLYSIEYYLRVYTSARLWYCVSPCVCVCRYIFGQTCLPNGCAVYVPVIRLSKISSMYRWYRCRHCCRREK